MKMSIHKYYLFNCSSNIGLIKNKLASVSYLIVPREISAWTKRIIRALHNV